MRSTIAPEFGCSRGADGSALLKGESGANGRQHAPGQLPDRKALNADEQPPGPGEGAGGPGSGDGESGGDGSEGVGSEGVGSEGVGSEGVGSEGVGSEGVGS